MTDIKRLLVANRGEIAIRVFRAATELKIRTVAIFTAEDRFALHRFKADESYQVGTGGNPIGAYLDIESIIDVAKRTGADAIHPGYGFLSENPEFADACRDAGICFVGPPADVMRRLGNKVQARHLAESANVPVMPASDPLPSDIDAARAIAESIGYPLMLKASWGGGGRGMRVLEDPSDLHAQYEAARREAGKAFGNDEVYFEKLVRRARHVEVQVLGDQYGNIVHLFERDCTVQRRHQKVVERAPAPYLSGAQRTELCAAALRLVHAASYVNAGTVEFLQDRDSGEFYFIEVNPRIQVEHTVTEEVTGVDVVKAQLRVAQGQRIGEAEGLPPQEDLSLRGHALQCRITTENPENDFVPDYGRIATYRSASGFGIRLDGGTAYAGARVTPYYDSLLVKVSAWAPTPNEAIDRMDRALREFRVRGVSTNLAFLENLINHPTFRAGDYTTRFIDETPELFRFRPRRDRATRLLRFIGDVIVNGNPETRDRAGPRARSAAPVPQVSDSAELPRGHRERLLESGPEAFAQWMRAEPCALLTDTTMRDAHQSLLATRMRTIDLVNIANVYAHTLPQLFSLECWGGATFDVAMRFLHEDPWSRLEQLRERVPNIPFQMLLRASNAVGYTNYPDNVVRYFVERAADTGIDIFRVFDSLNWVENMRVAMDAVLESGALCEGTICYSGNMLDAGSKYDLDYYLSMAAELESAGAHIIGIKDMAGVCRPEAIRGLVTALRGQSRLPIHFHTHDTSGTSAATVMAALEAGVDAVDGAVDSMSGLTSQPNLSSIIEMVADTERNAGIDREALFAVSHYWEVVRQYYSGFESDIRSGTADVYRHAMPGGQYTNLREQARALGIEREWPKVSATYAEVNEMFGDIIKVTPSSKVVGDMALYMVTSGLTGKDVLDPERDIDFPESVVGFFRGELGQPYGGFPKALQKKVLKGGAPIVGRPGESLAPLDLDATRTEAETRCGRRLSDNELSSYTLYPQVFTDFAEQQRRFGAVSAIPTPTFFYGMDERSEVEIELEPGKILFIRFLAIGDVNDKGQRRVFFEVNGQPRSVWVEDRQAETSPDTRPKADPGNPGHVAAPMPGVVVKVSVREGQQVEPGDALISIEAMKMETVLHAEHAGVIQQLLVSDGSQISAKDLLAVID